MSTEDSTDDGSDSTEESRVTDHLGDGADRAIEEFDESLVELLSWVLDTETRARIYVFLRKHRWSTSEEVAAGTGLYPSTVREALAALHGEGVVERRKRDSSGAGNNPFEYSAIAPSELVSSIVEDVQAELNTVFNLDEHLGGRTPESDPVRITVREEADGNDRNDRNDRND